MSTITNVPICGQCKTNPVEFCGSEVNPNEPEFSATCLPCFWVTAAAPWCHYPECSRLGGTRTTLVMDGTHTDTATARYLCPNGHDHGTAVGWATASGRAAASRDVVEGPSWHLEVRLSDRGIAGSYNAEHPARRAYARAYTDTALELLMTGARA